MKQRKVSRREKKYSERVVKKEGGGDVNKIGRESEWVVRETSMSGERGRRKRKGIC